MIEVLIITTMATITQYINASNKHVVHIKFTQYNMSHRLQFPSPGLQK